MTTTTPFAGAPRLISADTAAITIMAGLGWDQNCSPNPPGIYCWWFPFYWSSESFLNFVWWVTTASKTLATISKLYGILRFSLVGALPWLYRFVRVGYVCLFPGPPLLVAHFLTDEVVLMQALAGFEQRDL